MFKYKSTQIPSAVLFSSLYFVSVKASQSVAILFVALLRKSGAQFATMKYITTLLFLPLALSVSLHKREPILLSALEDAPPDSDIGSAAGNPGTPGCVYVCQGPNFAGPCDYKCVPTDTEPLCIQNVPTFLSLGPDAGTQCKVYSSSDCQVDTEIKQYTWPGEPCVPVYGSFSCWADWGQGPGMPLPPYNGTCETAATSSIMSSSASSTMPTSSLTTPSPPYPMGNSSVLVLPTYTNPTSPVTSFNTITTAVNSTVVNSPSQTSTLYDEDA